MALTALLLASAARAGYAQAPSGAEFQVNAYTTSIQWAPAVARDASGNFVVVCPDRNRDGANLEFARMGAMSVKTGAEGTLFFDQFESRRTTPPLEQNAVK
jgi:hypothetical protein